jgi:hypothetical protein
MKRPELLDLGSFPLPHVLGAFAVGVRPSSPLLSAPMRDQSGDAIWVLAQPAAVSLPEVLVRAFKLTLELLVVHLIEPRLGRPVTSDRERTKVV